MSMELSMSDWKPWEWYPNVWPTEAKFWTWMRGCFRNAIWNRSPCKIIFKNTNCFPPPEGYTGRAKSGSNCALSGVWEGKSKLEVDHLLGNVSLLSEDDITDFVKHLVPPPGSLQLVTKEAHKIKSYAEKQGIPFEQAAATKKAIQIIKDKKDKEWLQDEGLEPASSVKLRRQQIIDKLLEE
jgi:hypothetical protein